MKVCWPVTCVLYPEDETGVRQAIARLRGEGLPFRFLGNGTNVIVADEGLRMGLIRTTGMKRLSIRETDTGALVEAGAGISLKVLIKALAARGLAGLEMLYGIPGTVGGAIRMNAGSFGASISDCLVSVRYMDAAGEVRDAGKADMAFGYRCSSISEDACVLEATFDLGRGDQKRIEAEMERVWRERLEKHPMDLPSAGSIFKNNSGGPSWRYIDEAGLRGFRIGNACVSGKHPNFIVNEGGATASDVKRLIGFVKRRVLDVTGVGLEEEVELWGFDDND
jgi:UDP-N-acetylmuramate dehydrogenase